jgi:YHS domain-containing protein
LRSPVGTTSRHSPRRTATSPPLISLRNLSEPVELFEPIRVAAPGRSVDPVCRMMVHPTTAAGRLGYGGMEYLFCSLDCAAKFAARPDRFVLSEHEE